MQSRPRRSDYLLQRSETCLSRVLCVVREFVHSIADPLGACDSISEDLWRNIYVNPVLSVRVVARERSRGGCIAAGRSQFDPRPRYAA